VYAGLSGLVTEQQANAIYQYLLRNAAQIFFEGQVKELSPSLAADTRMAATGPRRWTKCCRSWPDTTLRGPAACSPTCVPQHDLCATRES
jgi:hypothetical protein